MTNLEGIFEAAEIKYQELIDAWYKNWPPLEVANGYYANTGQDPALSEVEGNLSNLVNFLEAVS